MEQFDFEACRKRGQVLNVEMVKSADGPSDPCHGSKSVTRVPDWKLVSCSNTAPQTVSEQRLYRFIQSFVCIYFKFVARDDANEKQVSALTLTKDPSAKTTSMETKWSLAEPTWLQVIERFENHFKGKFKSF